MRNQKIRERTNIQFRAEAFNIFNTLQLGEPDSSVTSPTFGRIRTGAGQSPSAVGHSDFLLATVFIASMMYVTKEDPMGVQPLRNSRNGEAAD
jgi:hypothetical protein